MPRLINFAFYIDWDRDGGQDDETSRLINASGSFQFSPPNKSFTTGRGYISQAVFLLDNKDGRFSSLNSGGAKYAAIANGAGYHLPVSLKISIDGGSNYDFVFTGVAKIPQETAPTAKESGVVTLDCRGMEETILNSRISTSLGDFSSWHDAGNTEDELIRQTLIDAGLSDGADFVSPYYYDNVSSGSPITIDRGRFIIPFYWLDDESPIEEIWQLAQACGGRFYADNDGTFRYEALDHWLHSPHTTSQETLDEGDYESIAAKYDDDDVWSRVVVESSTRTVDVPAVLWEPDETPVIQSGETKTITARLQQPAYSINTATYRAVTAGGSIVDDDITLTQTNYAQRVELQFENDNSAHAAHIRQLSITGTRVVGGPTMEESAESVDSFWASILQRTRAVRGNVYVQTRAQAATMATYLRDRLQVPALTYEMRGVVGDPGRKLGDYITISNAALMPDADETAYIIGVRWRLNSTGFVQDLTAIDANNVFQLDADDYFVIGTDLCGTGPARKVMFY
jgi:hypothetical protein